MNNNHFSHHMSWHKQTTNLFWSLIASIFISGAAMAFEEPDHGVIEQEKPFELRQYAPKIIAHVEVKGSMDEASGRGFQLIAG